MSTPVEQATVERVAEAIWRASCKRNPAKPPWPSVNFATQDHCRELAEAAIEALQLPIEWGVGIRLEGGGWDVNLHIRHSERDARKLLKSLNATFPDDRRQVVSRFGRGPWTAGEAL